MPIYEYRCQACGHELEVIQKFSDPVLTDCPQCGKAELQKLISLTGFQLKGTGWYVTDFKDGNKKPSEQSVDSASAESKSGAGPTSDATASKEQKAEVKAEAKSTPKVETKKE